MSSIKRFDLQETKAGKHKEHKHRRKTRREVKDACRVVTQGFEKIKQMEDTIAIVRGTGAECTSKADKGNTSRL